MGMKRKVKDTHAAARLIQRYGGQISMGEIYEAMAAGNFNLLCRQSRTRWLCSVRGVYFVWGTRTQKLITVLSPKMAGNQIRSYA
jgi:hypothetical protein